MERYSLGVQPISSLKTRAKLTASGIAHLAADEVELVVGLPDQAAGFLHAQMLAVTAEGRAADLAEDRADVVGVELQMLRPDRPE